MKREWSETHIRDTIGDRVFPQIGSCLGNAVKCKQIMQFMFKNT